MWEFFVGVAAVAVVAVLMAAGVVAAVYIFCMIDWEKHGFH